MKKKILLIISCVTISALAFTGCGISAGVSPRNTKSSHYIQNVENAVKHDYKNLGDTIAHSGFWKNGDFWGNLNIGNIDISNDLSDIINDTTDVNTPDNEQNSSGEYVENLNKSITNDSIDSISINLIASKFTMKLIDGNDFTIDCSGSSRLVKSTTFTANGDSILLNENSTGNSNNKTIGDLDTSRTVVLGIPSSFNGNITLNSGAGDININDITFKELTINQGMGDIKMNLSKPCGNMDVKAGMGSFTATLGEVGGNLTYKGGMGSADISIPENSPVKIVTETGMGSINNSAKTSSDYKYTFKLDAGMGSLNIR